MYGTVLACRACRCTREVSNSGACSFVCTKRVGAWTLRFLGFVQRAAWNAAESRCRGLQLYVCLGGPAPRLGLI